MLFAILVIILCFMLGWFYMKWVKVKNYWSVRGVPHLSSNPLMGNLTFLQRQNPREADNKAVDNLKQYMKRTAEATKCSESTVRRIVKVKKDSEFLTVFQTPGKNKRIKQKPTTTSDHVVDMMTETFIIRLGYDDSDSDDDEISSDDSDDDEMTTSSINNASSSGFHVSHDDLMEGVSKIKSIWMRELYNRFKYPYVGVWLMIWRPAIVINSPELARNILIRDAANFRNKFMTTGSKDPIGLSLLFLKDPAWTNIRRRLSVAFTSAKLRSVQTVADSKSLELVKRIDRDKDSQISLRTMFADYTTDIFSISAFEVSSNAILTGDGAVRTITKDLIQFDWYRGISWSSIFFCPEIADLFRLPLLSRESENNLRCLFKVILERKNNEVSKEPRSLLDVLMLLKKSSMDEKEVYSDDFIIAQAAILLIGGFDTSASTLTYIVYQLAFSPDIQEKLHKDLLEAKEKHGDKLDCIISESTVNIDCIIKEVLRIFPPMSWLDRVALNDYKVDDNLTIKAGMPVYVNGVGMHTDPEYFPEPYKFEPDRFLPENESKIIPYTYMPFGDGPRNCIGQRFGMITLRYAMAAIFLSYKVEPYPNTPKPLDAKIGKRGLFLFPGEDLKVKFVPRK